ncbi:nuclear pore complex protein Nup98-Nup96-like isoform X2 [Clavelina lepadiformis]|uniref:nuclear pore complex protein Nup98-Nup96-like isoform X2 n=1 Tax=Clavelina lepadiformis TaxID=159417 RepID=UPI00404388C3
MFNQQKTGFGNTGFGQSSGGLFGNKSNTTSGGLFGSSAGFGSTTSSGFGGFGGNTNTGGIFGTPAPKPSGGLFGTPATQSGFGTSTSGFGSFVSQSSGGLFGSSTPASTSAAFGGSSLGFGGSSFGQQQTGTGGVKFAPTTGSDTMMKNGVQSSITTKHQCITAMKEYEGKSFEELRTDDYLAGRKGPAAGGGGFGTTSSAGSGFSFGQKSTASGGGLFGTSTAKPAFGSSGTTGGLFGNTNTSTSGSIFGQNKPAFGTTTTTSSGFGGFGNTTGSSLFGNTASKPGGSIFGNTATTSSGGLFGNTGSSGFGTTAGFGGGGNLFGNKSTGFGTAASTAGGFGTTGGLFGTNTSKPSTGLFGNTPGFGQTNTGSLFGGNKPAFGSTNTSNTTGGLFGNTLNTANTQNKSIFGGFGSNTGANTGGSAFNFNVGGNTLGGGSSIGGLGGVTGLGGSLFGQQTATGGQQAAGALTLSTASNKQSADMLQALLTTPFGDSPLFKNTLDPNKRQEILKPTNPAAQKAAIQSPVYRVSPGPKTKIKLKVRGNSSVGITTSHGRPHQLFAGLEPEVEAAVSNKSFVGRSSVKRLTIKVTPNSGSFPGTPQGSASPSSSAPGSVTSENVGRESDSSSSNQHAGPATDRNGLMTDLTSKQAIDSETAPKLRAFTDPCDDTMIALNVRTSRSEPVTTKTTSPTATEHRLAALDRETERKDLKENGSAEEIGSEPHPAGIKLTRSGYYTIPSIKELGKMVDEDNKCKIVDFTIGRTGYGSVFFEGEVDITGMDFDSIVHIRRKEVTIYPDDDEKPLLGVGLNRRAEITLDCVWPTDKTTREPVTSPDRLNHMKWAQKLEQTTTKMGARFKEYRPNTGSWVFQVNHFSKYGLPESDDEAGIEVDQPKEQRPKDKAKLEKVLSTKTGLWSARVSNDDSAKATKPKVGLGGEEPVISSSHHSSDEIDNLEQHDDDFAEPHNGAITGLQQPLPSSHKMAVAMGVKAQNLQSMKASFFGDDDDAEMLTEESNQAKTKSNICQSMIQTDNRSPDVSQSDTQLSSFLTHQMGDMHSPSVFAMNALRSGVQKKFKKLSSAELKSPHTPSFLRVSVSGGELSPLTATSMQQKSDTPRMAKPPPKMPSVIAPKRLPANLPRTLQMNKESMLGDASLFLGRSFRVGWGPGWTFIHSGNVTNLSSKDTNAGKEKESSQFGLFSSRQHNQVYQPNSFTVKVERVKAAPQLTVSSPLDLDGDASADLPYLDAALRHSDFVAQMDTAETIPKQLLSSSTSFATSVLQQDQTTLPLIVPSTSVNIIKEYADIAQRAWDKVQRSHPDSGSTHLCHLVFGLCQALWGRIPVDDHTEIEGEDGSSYQHQVARKRAYVLWLINAIRADVVVGQRDELTSSESLDLTLSYVLEGRTDKAVKHALKSGNGHLALLLSLSASSVASRIMVAKQLVEWEEIKADEFISDSALKIYSLLAGKPIWLCSKGNVNTCGGLDWKRSLLAHINFISDPVAPIADGLLLYRAAWKGDSEFGVYSAAPLPSYVERTRQVVNDSEKEKLKVRDICYHLLQLYCKRSHRLDTTLCPSSSVPHPLDHRVAWHVWRILHAAGYRRHLNETSCRNLHTSYAAQLEAHGHWHKAVFVLMHITDDREREIAVRNLIGRHVVSGLSNQESGEQFITQELGVPEEWLHECRALHARYTDDHATLARHLLLAKHWKSGHDVVLNKVAADALIEERFHFVCDLLQMIENSNATRFIPDWATSGKVYIDYVKLKTSVQRLQETMLVPRLTAIFRCQGNVTSSEIEMALEDLQPEVTSLCQRVAELKCSTPKDRLARAEMAKQTLNLHNALHALHRRNEVPKFDRSRPSTSLLLDAAPTHLIAPQASRMLLLEDYALDELRKLVSNHFTELLSLGKSAK